MPTISWFYGIAIRMFYNDHAPPHFHAFYGEHAAVVSISDGEIIEGSLPRAASRLVRDWALRYRTELMDNWQRARAGIREPLLRIPGLDADDD
jgi:Domain of unknown function (DUF4160)